jgi:hypothetical protein
VKEEIAPMLTAPTLEKLQQLKLDAMAHAWTEQHQQAALSGLAFDERFGLLVDDSLAVYLTKGLTANGHLPNRRRWSCSRGFFPPKRRQRSDGQGSYSPYEVGYHRRERAAAGASIKDTATGFSWSVACVARG